MGEPALHLIKVPMRTDKLVGIARRRAIAVRELDDGYLAHCLLRELWQDKAPAPFVLRGSGSRIDAWGYSRSSAGELIDHARAFGDPALTELLGSVDDVCGKAMPVFLNGTRIGFHLRACPVVRLSKERTGHRAGAEIDAFLAKCQQVGREVPVSREEVYRDWLKARLGDSARSGVTIERVAVAAFTRERLVRRTQGPTRQAAYLERPDVRFEGELIVTDGTRFCDLLDRGVGRHRAFGFGALLVVPPGTPYPRT